MPEILELVDTSASSTAVRQTSGTNRAVAHANPAYLLQMAVEQGADLDRLERLMALQERWEANEARKAYTVAMAEFKKNPPEIFKTKLVAFSGTEYMHATLGDVCQAILQGLAGVGISHRWDTKQDGSNITVTCILTHQLGHNETTTLMSQADTSGKKNPIQAMASAVTYLQRYTLLAASGLATKDLPDDDGEGSGDTGNDPMDSVADKVNERTAYNMKFLSRAEQCPSLEQINVIRKEANKEAIEIGHVEGYNAVKTVLIARAEQLKKEGVTS